MIVESNFSIYPNVNDFDLAIKNWSKSSFLKSFSERQDNGNLLVLFIKNDIENESSLRQNRQTKTNASCFVQTCEQVVSGRDLSYERALEIIQSEEYLTVVDIGILRKTDEIENGLLEEDNKETSRRRGKDEKDRKKRDSSESTLSIYEKEAFLYNYGKDFH